MAYTYTEWVSDGSRTVYPVDFELGYLRKEYVYVYTGTLEDYGTQLDYTWTSNSEIELTTPVPFEEPVFIRRIVERDSLINNYQDGAILYESNLDDSYTQTLAIQQEVADGFVSMDSDGSIIRTETTFEAPVHILEPTEDTNPTTKLYVDTYVDEFTYDKNTIDVKDAATLEEAQVYTDNSISNISGADAIVPIVMPRMVGDGVTAEFPTFGSTQNPTNSYMVYLGGIKQQPTLDYTTTSSGNVVFIVPPEDGVAVDITLFQPQSISNVAAVASVMMINKYITNNTVVSEPYNALSVSPTVNTGVEVLVQTGATYVVL